MSFFDTVEEVFSMWHYDHPRILYALMRSMKPDVAVEVGTYTGYAACYMAQALKENGKGRLYCIDDFSLVHQDSTGRKNGPEHVWSNLHRCGLNSNLVTLLEGKSEEVEWPDKVDFAYVDGWHGYNEVEYDFNKCASLGAECICLDDVNSTVGPSLFVQRLRDNPEWDVCEVFRDCGIAICVRRRKKKPVSFCQESLNNPGVDLTALTTEEKRTLFKQLTLETGVDYGDFRFE